MPQADNPPGRISRTLMGAFVLLLLIILAAGALFYHAQEQHVASQVRNDLASIGNLKTGEIESWRTERISDVRIISQNRIFRSALRDYLQAPDPARKQQILGMFSVWINATYNSRNIRYVNPGRQVVLSLDPDETEVSPYLATYLDSAAASKEPVLTSFTRNPRNNRSEIYAIAPLNDTMEDGGFLGFIVLDIDPSLVLYPLIQTWPVPSTSAETLLVERQGDHILYLNDLRSRPDAALNLTIPLAATEVPAVMGVLGKTGPVEGRDYRGVDVISVVQPVPDSPWYMVAKMDRAEAFSAWQSSSGLIIALVIGTLAGAVVIAALIWQRQQKQYFRSLYAAEVARRKEEDFSRMILDSSPAFYAEIDKDGRTVRMNRALLAALEYTAEEVAGRDYLATFVPAEDRFALQKTFEQNSSGKTTVSTNRIISKSGRIYTVEWRGNPLDSSAGKPGVFIGIGIDVTERKKAEEELIRKNTDIEAAYEEITASEEELRENYEELGRSEMALRESGARLRRFYDSGLFGVVYWNMAGAMTDANDTFLAMVGYTRDDLAEGRLDWSAMTPPEFAGLDQNAVLELKETGINRVPYEKEYFRKDGTRVPILIACAMVDEQREDGVAFIVDITELKRTRTALTESERKYRNLYQYALVGLFETSFASGTILACNQRYAELAGFDSATDAIGKDIPHLYVNPEERLEVGRILREQGYIENFVARFRNQRTGREFWGQFSARYNPGRDAAEGMIIDITAQKEAEQALRASERHLRKSQEVAHLGSWELDLIQDRLTWSDEVYRIFGVVPHEFAATFESFLGFVHPEDREMVAGAYQRSVDEGRETYEIEHRIIRKDTGETRIVHEKCDHIRDGNNRIVLSVGTVLDITERKLAEEALRESEARFREVFNHSLAGKSLTSAPDGRLLMVNKAFADMLGYTIEELQAEDIAAITHPEDLQKSRDIISALLNGEIASARIEKRYLHKTGRVVWGDVSTSLMRDAAGKPLYLITTILDITERRTAEEKIRSSIAFLDRVIDMSPFAMWISDREGTVTRVNRSLCETIRLSPDAILGKYNVLHDANLEKQGVMPEVKAVFEHHRPARFSIWWQAAEAGDLDFQGGRNMFIDVSLFPVLDTRGELTSIVCQWIDITERRAAEERLREANENLRENEQRLREAQAMAHLGFWSWDVRTGNVEWSGEVYRIFHLDPEKFSPRIDSILAFSPWPEDHERDQELIRRAMDSHEPGSYEQRFLRSDGSTGYYYSTFEGRYDEAGNLVRIVGTVLDITGRKEAEQALRESETKYRELFENITAGFALHEIITDESGKPSDYRFLLVNEAFERMTGLSGAAIVNRTVREILPGIEPAWIERYGAVALGGKSQLFEDYSSGLGKWFEVRVYSPVPGQFATVITDITQRRSMEREREILIHDLEQKNAELERFTYSVSHDLKSPLITIKGFAGMLVEEAEQGNLDQIRTDVQRITHAADTMQQLLTDVLELSRVGKIINPPARTSFASIAQEAVDLLEGPLAERGVVVKIDPDLPDVMADHNRIREVMVNLIENAIKFFGTRTDPHIRIGADTSGGTPVFFVQDNGIGIDPRYLSRIFNLFEKLNTGIPGTGIGLPIVKRIIEVHGGKIWAESEGQGTGTTFRFTLPATGTEPAADTGDDESRSVP